MQATEVLQGTRGWSVQQGDVLEFLATLPDDSIQLCLFSPPYVDARTYGVDFALRGEDWVAWMTQVMVQCARVCTGLVACVCEGRTEDRRYDCTPYLLLADLHRLGYHLRKPPIFFRFGIPGGGGTDWWRNDYEPVICLSRPGELPWSDSTVCGHPPRWAPGGEMSNRTQDGSRVNQWGAGATSASTRRKDGSRQKPGRPSHRVRKNATSGYAGGDLASRDSYSQPVLANPGNVLKAQYDAEEVRQLLDALATRKVPPGDVIRCLVGGGQMGSRLAHANEAPYPESLVEPFIRSFCPNQGIVLDPFSGSGTTGAVAVRWGRKFIGCDLRPCQVELSRRRISGETPDLFGGSP